MKRFFLLIQYAVILHSLYGQDSIYITVNTTDCAYCYNSFPILNKLAEENHITLLFKSSDNPVPDTFLKKTLKLEREFPVLYSDSIYNALSISATSGITIFYNKKPCYHSALKNFLNYGVHFLDNNSYLNNTSDSINLVGSDDDLPFQIVVNNGDTSFQFLDARNGVIRFFSKYPLKLLKSVSFDDIIETPIVKALVDTLKEISQYESFKPILEPINVRRYKVSPTFSYNYDHGWITQIVFSAPFFDTINNRIDVQGKPIYLVCNNTTFTDALVINDNKRRNTFPGLSYYFMGDSLIASQVGFSDSSTNLYLAQYKVRKGEIYFDRYYNAEIPEEYRKSGLNYKLLTPIIRYPLVFTPLSREVFNLLSNKSISLPFFENRIVVHGGTVSYDYLIKDVLYDQDKQQYKILIQEQDVVFVYTINNSLNEILTKVLVLWSEKTSLSNGYQSFAFFNQSKIMFVDSKTKALIVIDLL